MSDWHKSLINTFRTAQKENFNHIDSCFCEICLAERHGKNMYPLADHPHGCACSHCMRFGEQLAYYEDIEELFSNAVVTSRDRICQTRFLSIAYELNNLLANPPLCGVNEGLVRTIIAGVKKGLATGGE